MEAPWINASEDGQTEGIASYNYARLIYRLTKSFSRYDARYDILPELEFELSHGRAKPDIAICEPTQVDWLRDVTRPAIQASNRHDAARTEYTHGRRGAR
jgi:hypothetical protein